MEVVCTNTTHDTRMPPHRGTKMAARLPGPLARAPHLLQIVTRCDHAAGPGGHAHGSSAAGHGAPAIHAERAEQNEVLLEVKALGHDPLLSCHHAAADASAPPNGGGLRHDTHHHVAPQTAGVRGRDAVQNGVQDHVSLRILNPYADCRIAAVADARQTDAQIHAPSCLEDHDRDSSAPPADRPGVNGSLRRHEARQTCHAGQKIADHEAESRRVHRRADLGAGEILLDVPHALVPGCHTLGHDGLHAVDSSDRDCPAVEARSVDVRHRADHPWVDGESHRVQSPDQDGDFQRWENSLGQTRLSAGDLPDHAVRRAVAVRPRAVPLFQAGAHCHLGAAGHAVLGREARPLWERREVVAQQRAADLRAWIPGPAMERH